MGPTSDWIRKARSAKFYDSSLNQARGRLRLGMHDRGEEFIYADGIIHPEDIEGHQRHLPLHTKVIHLKEHRINADEVYDVTVDYQQWESLHFREELYCYVHIHKLIVQPGAIIRVRGNIFVLQIDELILDTEGHDAFNGIPFQIQILGTDHPAFSAIRRFAPTPGLPGPAGTDGKAGNATKIDPSPFGPQLLKDQGDRLHGTDGSDGKNGQDGENGQNGGLSMLADLRFNQVENFNESEIEIFVQAGKGRDGSPGGNGGEGGTGGASALNLNSSNIISLPGRGGNGGNGGKGGKGGNGGLASNVLINIPELHLAKLKLKPTPSLGGEGGQGGKGGLEGQAGKLRIHQTKPKANQNDATANQGEASNVGEAGEAGRPGRSRPAAEIFITSF